MERKIGEIFEHDGEWYQCIKSTDDTCMNCDMNFDGKCPIPLKECEESGRSDKSYVIFKKLKKAGEPVDYDGSLYQGYISIDTTTDVCTYCAFRDINCGHVVECNEGIFYVKIKQKQEDMEGKKLNKPYIVYKHISPNGKEYVGMTRNIKKRWEGNGCSYTKNSEFRNDIMKYGWDNFQHIIVKDNLSVDEASKLEDELIVDAKNRGVAYNISRGGIGGSHPAWNKGIPLSVEQKAKLSTANKGKKLSDETKRKIGAASRGRIVTEETKRKIGIKNSRKHSREQVKKWMQSNKWRFRKVEIRKDEVVVGVYESIHEAARSIGKSRGFIDGIIRRPSGKHQGYTVIILD